MEDLNTSLNLYHIDALKEIAENLEVEYSRYPMRKSWLIQRLLDRIPRLAASPSFLEEFSDAARAALGVMMERDRVYTQRDVALPLMLSGLVHVEGQSKTEDKPKIETVLHTLLTHGLIVNLTDPMGTATRRTFSPLHTFTIPSKVRQALPTRLLKTPRIRSGEFDLTAPPALVESGDLQQFLRSLFFTWAELRRDPARRLKAGTMGKRDRRRIAESLGLDEEAGLEEVAWLHEFLEALNLANREGETIHGIDRPAVKLFWSTTAGGKVSDLIVAYVRMESNLGLDADALRSYTFQNHVNLQPASKIRTSIMETLNQVAEAGWLPFNLFFDLLTGAQIGSLILDPDARTSLYGDIHWYGGASRRMAMESTLKRIEYQAVLQVLEELRTMGLVSVGYSSEKDELPSALRLTSWLRAHYTNRSAAPISNGGQIILQPDFQILAMGPVGLSVLADFEWFATREKLDESVVTYRINKESVYRAFQENMTAETIQEVLEEASDQPVPQNVVRSLHDWQRQYERIVIRRSITVLQVDQPDRLTELLEDPKLSAYLHRLDERTAWFAKEHSRKIEAQLEALQMLPAYSSDPEADLAASLRWQEDNLKARHPVPSLYVEGQVSQIAEQRNGHWVLTPDRIEQAVDEGLDPLDIIERLERMTGQPLDLRWEKRLKAWGRYYGSGQSAEVRLLRLESEKALQELRQADERLSLWLRPLPEAHGLAVIAKEHWESARSALKEWGIEMEEVQWWAKTL